MPNTNREEIEVGKRIRSYDFQPREEIGKHYVEGTVTNMENGKITINVEVDTVNWGQGKKREEICTPIEMAITDWDGRLEILD